MTTYFIEPGDWESATGECLPSGSEGIAVVPVDKLLQWLCKREGEMESRKEETTDLLKKVSCGGQAKDYKDVQNFVEQRVKAT